MRKGTLHQYILRDIPPDTAQARQAARRGIAKEFIFWRDQRRTKTPLIQEWPEGVTPQITPSKIWCMHLYAILGKITSMQIRTKTRVAKNPLKANEKRHL